MKTKENNNTQEPMSENTSQTVGRVPSPGVENETSEASRFQTGEASRFRAALTTLEHQIQTLNQRFINVMVDTAVVQGKILPTEREHWVTQLANNFDAKSVELTNAKPILKTAFNRTFPNRNNRSSDDDAAEFQARQKQIKSLVNKKMTEEGIDYTAAFIALKGEHPELFGVPADEERRAANLARL